MLTLYCLIHCFVAALDLKELSSFIDPCLSVIILVTAATEGLKFTQVSALTGFLIFSAS